MSYSPTILSPPDNRKHIAVDHRVYGNIPMSFSRFNSSPRLVMLASHIKQTVSLVEGKESRIQSGYEYDTGKYVYNIIAPCNLRILKLVNKYNKSIGKGSIEYNPVTTIIYQSLDDGIIGHIDVPDHGSLHQYFGFKYQLNPDIRLVVGTTIAKDTIIADTLTKKENGGYSLGNEVYMAFMSVPGTAEDGYIVSRSLCNSFRYYTYKHVTVNMGSNTFALNIYGDDDEYKIHPEIGEDLREDGLLMCLRDNDPDTAIADMSISDTKIVDPYFDSCYYVTGGKSKIVDITTYYKTTHENMVPTGTDETSKKYGRELVRYYKELISIEKELTYEHKKNHGGAPLAFHNEFRQVLLLGRAVIANYEGKYNNKKVELLYKKGPLDVHRIDFVIQQEVIPSKGAKICDKFGGKGVVVDIWEDDCMPLDANGVRADIIGSAKATVNRMNLGRLYECTIGNSSDIVRREMMAIMGLGEYVVNHKLSKRECRRKVKNVDITLQQQAMDVYLEYLNIISPVQYEHYSTRQWTDDDLIAVLTDIVYDRVFTYIPVDAGVDMIQSIQLLEQRFPTNIQPVTYTSTDGRRVTTYEPIRIAPLHMMLLEKTAEENSGVSSAPYQAFGVLGQVNSDDKYNKPYKPAPVRTISETEGRLNLAYLGLLAHAELYDRNNNPTAHRQVYRTILEALQPNNIDIAVDRNIVPLGKSKPINIAKSMLNCAGIDFVYVGDKNTYK